MPKDNPATASSLQNRDVSADTARESNGWTHPNLFPGGPASGRFAPRIVDLTLPVRPGMRGVEFESVHTAEEHGWNSRMLHLFSHSGTHMDAQLHFSAGEGTVDAIPLGECCRPAWVVDLMPIPPRELIRVAHLGEIASRLRHGDALLLKTGWSKHADNPTYYRDNFPRVSEELAQWCVDLGIGLLGVEPPSVADVNNLEELRTVHEILLRQNIVIVEGLTNLTSLRGNRVLFFAAPLKIVGGDGAPCRAFAMEGWPSLE